jgi:hypothetical protein
MEQSTANWYTSLKILFIALLVGQVLMCGVVYFIAPPTGNPNFAASDLVKYAPILMLLLDAAGFFLGKNRTEAAAQIADVPRKFAAYRAAQLIKFGLTEGATMVAVILYFASGDLKMLALALVNIGVFATFFPAKNKIVNDLQLSSQEQALLDDPNFRG